MEKYVLEKLDRLCELVFKKYELYERLIALEENKDHNPQYEISKNNTVKLLSSLEEEINSTLAIFKHNPKLAFESLAYLEKNITLEDNDQNELVFISKMSKDTIIKFSILKYLTSIIMNNPLTLNNTNKSKAVEYLMKTGMTNLEALVFYRDIYEQTNRAKDIAISLFLEEELQRCENPQIKRNLLHLKYKRAFFFPSVAVEYYKTAFDKLPAKFSQDTKINNKKVNQGKLISMVFKDNLYLRINPDSEYESLLGLIFLRASTLFLEQEELQKRKMELASSIPNSKFKQRLLAELDKKDENIKTANKDLREGIAYE